MSEEKRYEDDDFLNPTVDALQKSGFAEYPHERGLWLRARPEHGTEDRVRIYRAWDNPFDGVAQVTLNVDLKDVPALVSHTYTLEQIEGALDGVIDDGMPQAIRDWRADLKKRLRERLTSQEQGGTKG